MEEYKSRADELHEKIVEGLKLARKRLIEKKQKEDGELVFSKNGEIIFVKARDMRID